jgi:hypothetical protein
MIAVLVYRSTKRIALAGLQNLQTHQQGEV